MYVYVSTGKSGHNLCCLAKSDLPVQERTGEGPIAQGDFYEDWKQPPPCPWVLCVVAQVYPLPCLIIHCVQWIRALQGVAGAYGTSLSIPISATWFISTSPTGPQGSSIFQTQQYLCQYKLTETLAAQMRLTLVQKRQSPSPE